MKALTLTHNSRTNDHYFINALFAPYIVECGPVNAHELLQCNGRGGNSTWDDFALTENSYYFIITRSILRSRAEY